MSDSRFVWWCPYDGSAEEDATPYGKPISFDLDGADKVAEEIAEIRANGEPRGIREQTICIKDNRTGEIKTFVVTAEPTVIYRATEVTGGEG